MNRNRLVAFTLLFALVALAFAPAVADAKDRWEHLGSRAVTDRMDHDTIVVTAGEGKFTALQLRVKNVGVQFRSMKIHFGNGETQEVELREVIRAGGSSRVIDVRGGDRVIKSVEFWYDSQSKGRQGTVRLFGRH